MAGTKTTLEGVAATHEHSELMHLIHSCAPAQVCEGLNGWNQDQALEAVCYFQDKYELLMARYQQMEVDFMEEADSLVAQLLDAMQQVCASVHACVNVRVCVCVLL